jgi:uncharacterized protein with predicted RNA binding PUA domain
VRVWTERHVAAVLEWTYGAEAARALEARGLVAERSRRTGRLRALAADGRRVFVFANDGVPRPTWRGAERLRAAAPFPRFRVVVDDDAAEFVAAGRSLFSRFVRSADPELVPGSAALLVDSRDRPLAVGRLTLAPLEMGRLRRGVAARVVAHARRPDPETEAPAADETLDAAQGINADASRSATADPEVGSRPRPP